MNGNLESKIAKLEETLNEYDKKFALSKIAVNPEIELILSLTNENIKALPINDCLSYSFLLAQFSLSIQKEVNRQNAKLKWLENELSSIVAKNFNNYGDKYTKFEVKTSLIINDNEYAKAINEYILDSKIKIEELNFISSSANKLSEILKESAKVKKAEYYAKN